jgi:3D (Asp-Asp-Asp) domain-containing protein
LEVPVKKLIAPFLFITLFSPPAFAVLARENPTMARVTVYWARGGSGSDRWTRQHKCSTGARLREGHCAVDPRKIPYGSQVVLPDGTKLQAVDTGSAVRTRRAARLSGRTSVERNAIVIDRFFETKRQALAWASRNPMFVSVQIAHPSFSATTVTKTTSSVVSINAAARPSTVAVTTQTVATTKPRINYGATIVHNPLNKLGR